MKKNLWILTEERPRKEVLEIIFQEFSQDKKYGCIIKDITIIPLLDKDNKFSFTYKVIGLTCEIVNEIYIKTVSGNTSFVDYLVFYQNDMPTIKDEPIYAIEETKTDDSESRNTGVYQRCTKFIFIEHYYPKAKKIMLYNLKIEQKKNPTDTYIFGTRLLLTYGAEILGKKLDEKIFKPFSSIDELLEVKSKMRKAPKGNVPIEIIKNKDIIQISGRLIKRLKKIDRLAHDPNIGALSIISAVIRKLGWNGKIEITKHGLSQNHILSGNKFIMIANLLDIKLQRLNMVKSILPKEYWHYETEGEKLGTIFVHIIVENFTQGYSLFENHAGCEKSYFFTSNGDYIPLKKYTDREKYKKGDKNKIIYIPDLVLIDLNGKIIIDIEGKKYEFREKGIEELNNYDAFDELYNKKYYDEYNIQRTVVLYGSEEEEIAEIKIGFLLNRQGKMILGINAPNLFKEAIKNLLDYYGNNANS
jgi:hypothetical protein